VNHEADVAVLGLGVGGERVASTLAAAGLSVIGIEAELIGGECAYWGCVPTKMMIRAANVLAEGRRVNDLAGRAVVEPDWSVVARRLRDDATHNWDDSEAADGLREQGVQIVRGRGRFAAPDTLMVGDTKITARRGVVIATGTRASIPPVPGLGDVPYLTNREVVALESLPDAVVVLGGGAIGLEMAQTLARFGSEVTVVESAERIASNEEPEVSTVLTDVLTSEGLEIRAGVEVERAVQSAPPGTEGGGVTLHFVDGTRVTGDALVVATGRHVDLRSIGAGNAGLDEDASAIEVDEHLQAAPGIWAIGDVTGQGLYTHLASHHAEIAAAAILGRPTHAAETRAVPRVTFTEPEVGAVGLTESMAREQGLRVRIGCADASDSARGWIHLEGNAELVKLVVDGDTDTLVGATTVGPMGGEVVAMLTLAVHARVPVSALRTMIYAYPTFHRTIESAFDDLSEP
jgi:pyruvate/2-oxoglutarate dehydrogenase complex dihydrolipoamide dehydrogenase (E3) component